MTEWALPQTGVFVTGTDTEVGKTWVSAHILRTLSHIYLEKQAFSGGQKTPLEKKWGDPPLFCARKPVASGASMWKGKLVSADTLALSEVTGEPLTHITRYTFAAPIAPNLAAQQCGIDTSMEKLMQACRTPKHSWSLVEGAGGFYSPLGADNSLNADLAQQLRLPVLLVVGLKLGCINHTLLTLNAIQQRGLHCVGIVLNDLHDTQDTKTAEILTKLTSLPLYLMPCDKPDSSWPDWLQTHLSL